MNPGIEARTAVQIESRPAKAAVVSLAAFVVWIFIGSVGSMMSGTWSSDATDGMIVALAIVTGGAGFIALLVGGLRARNGEHRTAWNIAIGFAALMMLWWALQAYDPGVVGDWGAPGWFTATLPVALAVPIVVAFWAR